MHAHVYWSCIGAVVWSRVELRAKEGVWLQVHQRVPLYVGSKGEIEYLESFTKE